MAHNQTADLRDACGAGAKDNIATNVRGLKRAGPLVAVITVSLALFIRLFKIVDHYSVDVFFGDHWTFEDSTLFQKHSWLEIFRWQHGPHRQGFGGLLLAAAEPLIHWNQRYVSFGLALIIGCACLAALWLKHRIFGKFGYSDLIIPLLFFTPVQYETLLGANNPSHGPLPLLLVVLYCAAWTISQRPARFVTVLLLNFVLIYTGFGLFIGLITPLLFGLEYFRSHQRESVVALAIALLSMVSFFIGYRNDPAIACFSPYLHGPLNYLVFLVFMLSSYVKLYPAQSTVVPALLAGSFLLLTTTATAGRFVAKLLREGTSSTKTVSTFILLTYSLIFCCAAAYGRTCDGLVPAPRYLIYLTLAFFGLYLAALSVKATLFRRECICVVLIISVVSSSWISSDETRIMSTIGRQRQVWKDCYIATRNIGKCDAASGSFIYSAREPADLKTKLDYLDRGRLSLFH